MMSIKKLLALGTTALVVALSILSLSVAGANAQPSPQGSLFVPVNPVRVLDTRNGTGGVPVAPLVHTLTFTPAGVPMGATAVVLNITTVNATDLSYLSVYPDGSNEAGQISQVTVPAGQPITDEVTVKVPLNRAIDIFNHMGDVNVVADLAGYYVPAIS